MNFMQEVIVYKYTLIDETNPNNLKRENISLHRPAFADQHGSFLRSEGKCLPYNFLTENVDLYNIIMLLY